MRHFLPAGALALLAALAVLLVAASAASAGVGISVGLTLPSATAVGDNDVSGGSFSVSNTNTPPNNTESNTVTQMRLALSCAAAGTSANACPSPDPGVFAVSPTGSGAAGTACAGATFTASAPDASGIVTFTRNGGPLVLPPPSGDPNASKCIVNITYDVLRVPSIDVHPNTGVQTYANFLGTSVSSQSGLTPSSSTWVITSVVRALPALTTIATDGSVGQPIHDTATVTSGAPAAPTGTVTFNLYGTADTSCTASPIFTSANRPVSAGGSATSANFVPTAPGSYRWRASYSGDVNHLPFTASCNAPGETSEVSAAPQHTPRSDNSVRGDFNGDGIGDLAVGAPGEDLGAIVDAGVVHVLPGSASGVSAAGSQLWSQDSAGITDNAETGDGFGSTLTAGDFNGDGRDDLAIGAPDEDVGAVVDAGAVHVLYGSAAGLTATGSQVWSQESSAITDAAEAGDRFGSALATGKLNSDTFAELLVGVPSESVGTAAGAGVFHVIPGTAGGVSAAGHQLWSQNTPGMPDVPETGDAFGASLATGDINNVAGQDLAVGAPGESVGTIAAAGRLHLIYAGASGLSATGSQMWSQDTAGIGDVSETGDRFASALAIGRLDSDASADLVVGVPEESIGTVAGAGVAHVIRGTTSGLTATGQQVWSQESSGITDTAETGDGFGASLAIGDINNVAGQDLAVGAPGEDIGTVVDAGVAHVVYGAAAGLSATGSQVWSQDSTGIGDLVEAGDRFATALAIGKLDSDASADLVVGVPSEGVSGVVGSGAAHVIRGATTGLTATGQQLWTQNSTGVVDQVEAGDGFGASLGA